MEQDRELEKYIEKGYPTRNVLRMGKNILQNSFNFAQFSEDSRDEVVCRNAMIYLAKHYNHRKDLFGFMEVTYNQFAQEMNLSKNQLNELYTDMWAKEETRANVVQAKVLGFKEFSKAYEENTDNLFVTRLENCLYMMLRNNFIYSVANVIENKDGKVRVDASKGIQLITDLKLIKIEKRGNKGYKKKIYVKLNDEVVENMESFFAFININAYKELTENGKGIYMFLCNVRNNLLNNISFDYPFEILKKATGVSERMEPKKAKHEVKLRIEEILKTCPELSLQFGWTKVTPDAKYMYKPVFSLVDKVELRYSHSVNLDKKKVYDDLLLVKLIDALFETYCLNSKGKPKEVLEIETMADFEERTSILNGFYSWLDNVGEYSPKAEVLLDTMEDYKPNHPLLKGLAPRGEHRTKEFVSNGSYSEVMLMLKDFRKRHAVISAN